MYQDYIDELNDCLKRVRFTGNNGESLKDYEEGMGHFLFLLARVKEQGSRLFFIGNGGSCAIASHMTADFMKNGGIMTCSLYDSAVTTCLGNDYGYADIFSRQIEFLAEKKDMLIAISSSGSSPNIIRSLETARKKGMATVTFTGFRPDNQAGKMGDLNVYVPSGRYGIVESIHNLILQQAVDVLMDRDGVRL